MNILMPMAGLGNRFANKGYTLPKPLIPVFNKSMIHTVIENINLPGNYIFIIQKKHSQEFGLANHLKSIKPDCSIIEIDYETQGAAITTLCAKDQINNDSPLIIANCDQIIDWIPTHFIDWLKRKSPDGGILNFLSVSNQHSYVTLDGSLVKTVVEKVAVSNIATVGIYYWKTGTSYVQNAESMIERNLTVNNEFYIAPVYNHLVSNGGKVMVYPVFEYINIGTPEALEQYKNG